MQVWRACRAGTTTTYSFGDDPAQIEEYAWYTGNSPEGYSKVGLKKPNPWGLHDMHGNLREFCFDVKAPLTPSLTPVIDPQGNSFNGNRAIRGGSFECSIETARTAYRSWNIFPRHSYDFCGFRIVAELDRTRPSDPDLVIPPGRAVNLLELIDVKSAQAKNELYSKEVNGEVIEEVRYRREEKDGTPSKEAQKGPPRLEGIKINGRWAVIYSRYDIGCALEKHQSVDCLGHDYESAKLLARAVVLYALRR